MEVSVIGSSQVNVGKVNDVGLCSFSRNLNAKVCSVRNNSNSKGCSFGQSQSSVWPSRSGVGFCLRASASPQTQAVVSDQASKITSTKPTDGLKLYVGLPLDSVSNSNTINHARALAAGLKALKLLGVAGVELPLWWGVAENEAMGKYDWTGYLAVIDMVQELGLEVHVSLCFHASRHQHNVSLPQWVSRIGESEPSIYFADRLGHQYKDCLSLSVDELRVLDGKSPLEVYEGFFENFKSTFSSFLGSTITGLTVGLGPDGELRYPSNHHHPLKSNTLPGPGEFQCYDKNMLANLKCHAEMHDNPLWGLGGPHDAPGYNHSPLSGGFFAESGGSWETPYGDFFLSWYSGQLTDHGDRVLSLAASTFKDVPVTLSTKIPLTHSWCKTRSHPSELTAGFYNTVNRDGYETVVGMFSKNSCGVVLPGLDLSDEDQMIESRSSPELLLGQIMSCCRKNGVEVSGQNSLVTGGLRGFEKIEKNLMGENGVVGLFTYQRMGAYFFSPEHFPSFTRFVRGLTRFVRGLNKSVRSSDYLPVEGEENAESLSGKNPQMQTA